MPWLGALLANLLGTAASRVLTGAGLALATTAAMMPFVLSALNAVQSNLSGVPANVLQVCLLWGFGEALSIIGAGMITYVGLQSARAHLVKAS